MCSYHIMLVEDMENILEYNKRVLENAGYSVCTACTVSEARRLFDLKKPDVAVLDIMLPDGSGVELCREFRSVADIPVIFLTCLGDSREVIQGLESGADDYMTKPYNVEELKARIEVLLRRISAKDKIILGRLGSQLVLDNRTGRAFLSNDDLLLKPKEYKMLSLLAENVGRELTPEEIYSYVWGMTPNSDIRTVRVHISSLRDKLAGEYDNSGIKIEGGRTKGYRLVVKHSA